MDKLNFLTSPEEEFRVFRYCVQRGVCTYPEINEVFKKIRETNYTKEETIIVIKNIFIASFNIPFERTDYHTPCGETLMHLAKIFDTFDASINLKITYGLYKYVFTLYLDDDNKAYCERRKGVPSEIYFELADRLKYLEGKDKHNKLAILMNKVYDSEFES